VTRVWETGPDRPRSLAATAPLAPTGESDEDWRRVWPMPLTRHRPGKAMYPRVAQSVDDVVAEQVEKEHVPMMWR